MPPVSVCGLFVSEATHRSEGDTEHPAERPEEQATFKTYVKYMFLADL